MNVLRIPIPEPHPAEAEILAARRRYRVVFAGRRFGKTEVGVDAVQGAMINEPGLYWWVGLSWRSASLKRAWRLFKRRLRHVPGHRIREVDKEIHIPVKGQEPQVWLRTAENLESLAGEGLRGVVLDEFTLMREEVWTEFIYPSLSDYGGWALFLGVPKGKNWGWRLWLKGRDKANLDWQSWQFPTAANPYIPASEIERARENLPERIFRQEYLAEVVTDAGGIFRGVMAAATADVQEPKDDHQYVFGVDWGKHNDFTVISVLDVTDDSMVAMDRFNQIDYAFQVKRLESLCERFRPAAIIAERNSMGEPLVEQLQRIGLPVQPFITTNATKAAAIEALALAIERQQLALLDDPVLIGELQAYEAERLPSGLLRYNAPPGMHDDCVMSLALAYQGIAHNVSGDLMA